MIFCRQLTACVAVAVCLASCTKRPPVEPPAASTATVASQENPLVWDAMEKTIDAKPGDGAVEFEFDVTNKSARLVTISEVHTSCGCTVAQLPSTPWKIAAGSGGTMKVTVDFSGKEGRVTKTVEITSSEGLQTLLVNVNIPPPDEKQRERNRRIALANRQEVFRNECATCHAAAIGKKTAGELFQAACTVCHISAHRASMVPDLLTAREHRDAAFWRKWITEGKEGSLMPAFAQSHGGPLTEAQIESLVAFALASLPTEPRPAN